jgi:PPP family 3-phenylpropionic acid transporter
MAFFNLSAFYFFYFAAVGVYIIFLPKVLHDIGYAPSDIGILFALAPLMRFLTPFLFLKHINLTQNIFKWSLYLSVVSSIGFYITIDNFTLFLFNNLILGICLSLVLPYMEVYAIGQLGKNRYGKSRLYGSIGFMVVALVLARFLDNPNTALHYYLIATILTAYFSILIIKDDNNKNEIVNEDNNKFSILRYWPFWLSLFLMQVSFGGFYNFFTIYETSHSISLEITSYLWAFGVICEIIMLYYQAPILKNNLISVIKISIFLTIIRWLILFIFPDSLVMTFISQSIHALSFGLYHSAVIMYLYTLYDDKKLAQQFMFGFAYGLGGFVGAIIAGWVYGEYLFLYSALIATFALISLYIKNIFKFS